jgi:plasmid maintenance system antidote protein VapI
MILHELMARNNMSIYRLAKDSGVPYATVNDLASGRTHMAKCKAGTVYKLALALDTTMERLLDEDGRYAEDTDADRRASFETFASNVCHRVKDIGDIAFIIEALESEKIRKYYERMWYPECFYLLATVDYLSRVNGLPPCAEFEDIRPKKLSETLYSPSVTAMSIVLKTDILKKKAEKEAIPEFKRFNIMEGNIRDAV